MPPREDSEEEDPVEDRFKAPGGKRRKNKTEKGSKVQGEDSTGSFDGDGFGQSSRGRSDRLRPYAAAAVAHDAGKEGIQEESAPQQEQQFWWFKLRRFGSRSVGERNEGGAFPQQDALKDSRAATPHRERVRGRGQRKTGGTMGG